jgi:hypothetical protein
MAKAFGPHSVALVQVSMDHVVVEKDAGVEGPVLG